MDVALVHDEDLVVVDDGVQPVGYRQHRVVGELLSYCPLDQCIYLWC